MPPKHVGDHDQAAASESATVTIGTHLWMHWPHIAFDQEKIAARAREELLALGPSDPDFGRALERETHASMIAVSAAAHAIDALYGEVAPLIPLPDGMADRWKANRTARPSRILETLQVGCRLGKRTSEWPPAFRELYTLRDAAVHHVIPPPDRPASERQDKRGKGDGRVLDGKRYEVNGPGARRRGDPDHRAEAP